MNREHIFIDGSNQGNTEIKWQSDPDPQMGCGYGFVRQERSQ